MLSTNSSQIAVEASLQALLKSYLSGDEGRNAFQEITKIITNSQVDFLTRSQELNSWIAKNQSCSEISDVLFDLLMVQFLSAEVHPEEYFDSPEWNEIENKTLDSGSEMLNLFLYLSEAKETEVSVSLDDFLNEFLLVGEDEFQDEYRIYESLIVNEEILDADLPTIREIQKTVKADTGLQDFFVSLVLFFQYVEEIQDISEVENNLEQFESGVLQSLLAFYQN